MKIKELCKGCKHNIPSEGFCYMFDKAPKQLPCGQHDKFSVERELTGKLLLKHPLLFFAFIQDAKNENL